MITPAFELSQEQHFLTITVHVPYARASEFDLYIDGEDFKLLTLPGRIVEDGREKASFDVDKGLFTIRIPKETPGQHFEGLDMLTALLAPKGSRSAKPLVEEMEGCAVTEEEEEEEFDWQIDQTPYVVTTEEELNSLCKYGFGNQRAGVFTRLQPWWIEARNEREKKLRTCLEQHTEEATVTFSEEEKEQLRKFTNKSYLLDKKASQQVWTLVTFSEEEKEQLRKFTNKSYLLDKKASQQVWISLVDIILAYAYEVRATEGETNSYNSIQNVLESCGRRVLCYPLYRHFKLIVAAIHDTSVILQLGFTVYYAMQWESCNYRDD
ncbi:Protein SHQ1-like [Acipenser ruthenus]|uniref:Protein SHQ1 homolog n=1 Tax=Acipenser ruthenus TaxID=7906 RepID=A0A662YL67_ACIRT|nr:Protein SHQ1-like [Acipenser ruthenus]